MPTEFKPGPTLYAEIVAAKIPHDSHESDFYFKDTRESRQILLRHAEWLENATWFKSEHTEKPESWISVPFAYQPWWDSRQQRGLNKAQSM